MTPAMASFGVGATALAFFGLTSLIVLRLPGRLSPVGRLAVLALAVHGIAVAQAAWLIPGVAYWHGAALYWAS